MNRAEFTNNFAKRICDSFQKKANATNQSQAKIEIKLLAKIAGVSYQMARKYMLGLALPEYYIIPKIAAWLEVSPQWLLFGDNDRPAIEPKSPTLIEIEKEVLKSIIQSCSIFFLPTIDPTKLADYIVNIINNIACIDIDDKSRVHIIDWVTKMAIEFNNINQTK